MRKALLIGCVAAMLALRTVVCGAEAEPAVLNIPEVSVAPALDGKLDDAVWQKAARIERLYPRESKEASKDTTIMLARDKQWLYVGVDCRNPLMSQVRQRVFQRGGPVFSDDSVLLFIRPDSDSKAAYEFDVSFANVQYNKRFNAAGVREDSWSAPWRSATQVWKEGWTGELVIPLFTLECDDLGRMQVNLVRVFMEVKLDAMNAFESDQRVNYALRPGWKGSGFDLANMVAAAGMGGFKPMIPFVPRIIGATVGGYTRADGRLVYGIEAQVASGSPVAGSAELLVLEQRAGKTAVVHAENIELSAGATRDIAVKAPADDFGARTVLVRLVECGRRENVLAETALDTRLLTALNRAYIGRSYVTIEPMPMRLEFGLSPELLKELRVAVEVNGKPALDVKALQPALTLEIPLDKLNEGENAVLVRLLEGENELARRELTARRLAPRPGYEVKLDLIKGIMLKDGQPYFPVGIYDHDIQRRLKAGLCDEDGEYIFKHLGEDIGLNTLVRGWGSNKYLDLYMKLAEKYGLNVMTWNYPAPSSDKILDTQKELQKLSPDEKRKIWRGWYEELEPAAIEEITMLQNYKNFIGYKNKDEPNLPPSDYRLAILEWYWHTVKSIDKYRPIDTCYAREIPAGDEWTRWLDILAYDVYPCPHIGGHMYNEPGWGTAYYAYELRERCRQDNKIMWFAPLSTQIDVVRHPIGMGKAHVLCQAYSAIIYGARGLLYFALSATVGEGGWDSLRAVALQVKELSPALLNGDIEQDIRYPVETFLPLERKFPMVNAALFKYPDGDYLLMAVNIRDCAAQTEFRVDGVRRVESLFGDAAGRLALRDNVFQDKIEGYGTRAYRLELENAPEILTAEITPKVLEEERAPRVDVNAIAAQLMLSKNFIANPCFQQQTNKGIPDFFNPYFCLGMDIYAGQKDSSFFIDDSMLWEGHPSLRMYRRPMNEPGPKSRGTWVTYCPPIKAKPLKATFSFYGRGKQNGDGLSIALLGARGESKNFKLTGEWKRYEYVAEILPDSGVKQSGGRRMFLIIPAQGATVWINGLQLEEGEKATEFQDDSIIVKKK